MTVGGMAHAGPTAQAAQELVLALLGFTGDVVVCDPDAPPFALLGDSRSIKVDPVQLFQPATFRVKDGCNSLTEAERDQVNRIAPLGRYYLCFQDYAQHYSIQWRDQKTKQQLYKLAIAGSLHDLLQEYIDDVADLELEFLADSSLPLSYFTQRTQKYLISFPQVFSTLKFIEENGVRGCQLIDCFAQQASGLPALCAVVGRIMSRLKAVCLRQSFAWMVHGTLSDGAGEFFVRSKDPSPQTSTLDAFLRENDFAHHVEVLAADSLRVVAAAGAKDRVAATEDWAKYYLSMEHIPAAFVTAAIASKILFAGRATMLMKHIRQRGEGPDEQATDCFNYLSRGAPDALTPSARVMTFTDDEIESFDAEFEVVLSSCDDHATAAALSRAVTRIADQASSKLWTLMHSQLQFSRYLHAARSIYLLGKGEFVQCLLDHLFASACDLPDGHSRDDLNRTLNFVVLPNVMKTVGVEDDVSVARTLHLSISSASVRLDSWDELQQQLVVLVGCAAWATKDRRVLLPDGVDMCAETRLSEADKLLLDERMALELNLQSDCRQMRSADASNGALWLQDFKNITKGFQIDLEFALPWSDCHKSILSSLSFSDLGAEVVLGGVAVCVQYDPRGPHALGAGASMRGVTNALLIKALACVTQGRDGRARRFIKLQVCRAAEQSLRSLLHAPVAVRTSRSPAMFDESREEVLAEQLLELDGGQRLNTIESYRLRVRYSRHLSYQNSASASGVSLKGEVAYSIKAHLGHPSAPLAEEWDVDTTVDMRHLIISSAGGMSTVGVLGAARQLEGERLFSARVQRVSFDSGPAGSSGAVAYPVCSAYTSTHHPDTLLALEQLVGQYTAVFSHLRAQLLFPSVLRIVFDGECCRQYERLFQLICKVRAVGYALERMWLNGSKSTSSGSATVAESVDRNLNNIRHAMHFFIANLLYYLQVDVVDSEFGLLLESLQRCSDFQSAVSSHRQFLAALVRLSWLDQLALQENLDRILHLCWRFVAACRLHSQSLTFGYDEVAYQPRGSYKPPPIVPAEEFSSILHDFYQQVQYLVFIMRSAETRGFLLRLDFNGFLSQLNVSAMAAKHPATASAQPR